MCSKEHVCVFVCYLPIVARFRTAFCFQMRVRKGLMPVSLASPTAVGMMLCPALLLLLMTMGVTCEPTAARRRRVTKKRALDKVLSKGL